MLLSVITPTFNSEDNIKRNIESLNKQKKIFEQIFIDNLSSDTTLEIIKKISKYSYKIIRDKDYGIYEAMNKGISNSNGEFLLFLNSDDWLPEKTFEIVAMMIK